MLVGGLALAACLATRHAGPSYEDGVYTYNAGGRHKAVRLSSEAARRFDAKVAGDIPESRLPEAVLRGVPITEEELNSRVAEDLERTIAVVMPPQVRAFSYEEGQLRVLINPLAR